MRFKKKFTWIIGVFSLCILVHVVLFSNLLPSTTRLFRSVMSISQIRMLQRHLVTITKSDITRIPNWMNQKQFVIDVKKINDKQYVRNSEKFPFKITSDSVVILVQIHDRLDVLKMQLESFRNLAYINETLVIFSHDHYSKNVFALIDSIDFCPILQIFYPYPIQVYNNKFPGDDPNDCPRDLAEELARQIGCNNAAYPDLYHHYREARHTQLKHHWLWKLQFVFERSFFKDVKGVTVLRLDDDYFLANDAIHFIKKTNDARKVGCKECDMYVLGEMDDTSSVPYSRHSDEVFKTYWYAGVGRGQVFTKGFWEKLKKCQKAFCLFDDCNWDWALQHVAEACLADGVKTLKPSASRLFHLGKCKGFHRNLSCTTEQWKQDVDILLAENSKFLFPKNVKIVGDFPERISRDVPYGGWADIRDHQLCYDIFENTTLTQEDLYNIHRLLFQTKSKVKVPS